MYIPAFPTRLKSGITMVALSVVSVAAATLWMATLSMGAVTTRLPSSVLSQWPVIHGGTMEEAFLRAMARHYGVEWQRWMPEAVVAEHWRRFPSHFGSGPEAAFSAWMTLHFGMGWQQSLPAHVVYQCWCDFSGARSP